MRVIHSLNECSTLKKNKLPLTDSVWHGLLLEVHVLVVGVEPRRLVREKLRAQAEEEAVVGAVELRTELPGTGRETTEFVAGLKKTKVETRSLVDWPIYPEWCTSVCPSTVHTCLFPYDDKGGTSIEQCRRHFGEALSLLSAVKNRPPLRPKDDHVFNAIINIKTAQNCTFPSPQQSYPCFLA